MDKYTVDLDKVLNDFEYSELTDHYNSTAARTGSYDYVSSQNLSRNNNVPPSGSYGKINRGGDVKHSITNVFNSLDEYINSDIGVSDFALKHALNNHTEPSTKSINKDIVKTTNIKDVNTVKYDGYVNNLAASETHQDPIKSDEVDVDVNDKNVGKSVETRDNIIEISEEVDEINRETVELETNDNETVELEIDDKVGELETNSDDKTVITHETVSIDKIEDTSDSHFKTVIERDNVAACCDFIPKAEPISIYKDHDIAIDANNESNKQSEIVLTPAQSSPLPFIIPDDKTSDVPEITVGCAQEENHPITISFSNEFDCDETELDRYLEEFENELIEKPTETDNDIKHDETIDCTNETDSGTNKTDDNKLSTIRPATLNLNEDKREINLIGEPGSTPYNNIYVSKQLPPDNKKVESDTDTSRSASPTFSDISSDCTGSTTPSTETVNEEEFIKKTGTGIETGVVDKETDGPPDGGAEPANLEQKIEDNARNESNEQTTGAGDGDDTLVEDVENCNSPEVAPQNTGPESWLGKQAPLWIPDSEALSCLHCDMKFTVIKRRHHCRACGLVLCSKCCNLRFRLEYLDSEARVCAKCYDILGREESGLNSDLSMGNASSPNRSQPNPNNPMEYCSMVPPLQQVSNIGQNPPTVMVPVSVLKRKGSNKARSNKSVMFCDGIRPGSDLTNLDSDFNYNESKSAMTSKKVEKTVIPKPNRNVPALDSVTKSFIPDNENSLPPTVTVYKTDINYTDCSNNANVVEMLKNEMLTFALQRNLHVHVKIINMNCCINKIAWCFSTEGLINVGQDEVVILLEVIDNERAVPKDVFHHINNIYTDAVKGTTVKELGISLHSTSNFLDSKNHSGFLYVRPTFQCLQNVIKPKETYLIGILIHRWETPWAKIFPLRLILRLGAEYRYYPSPIISSRHRESVFVEIGHTIINLLADFRNFSYTLPQIRGLTIHMEDKNTTVMIPTNRYDQVMKSLSNSSDHILAFAGNFSMKADSHLVCIQDTQGNNENSYTTHAINIHNKPRKVTGASFIVFNGALKSSSGLTAKSSIVEDGLMIQIPADNMVQIRESLRNMKNHTIQCGCVNSVSDESVSIIWGEPDTNFNVGVTSPIDDQPLDGVPSIRVHNGKDYICNSGNRLVRWTEVFILQNSEENSRNHDPVDVSKLAENISKATCQALVKYLDLLCTNNFYKIAIRTTLHVENVSYSAGSNSIKLPPIYMKSLDNELIPVLHRITTNNLGENAIVLELIFRILNV